jgi:hypothetical protein
MMPPGFSKGDEEEEGVLHNFTRILLVMDWVFLTLPFFQPILSLLDYELPILNERNLEHLRLKVSR